MNLVLPIRDLKTVAVSLLDCIIGNVPRFVSARPISWYLAISTRTSHAERRLKDHHPRGKTCNKE